MTANLKFLRDVTPNEQERLQSFDRMMFFLGFKKHDYIIDSSGQVCINNIANVVKCLEQYRNKNKDTPLDLPQEST